MKESYIRTMELTLERSLKKYLAVNEAKIQIMLSLILKRVEKLFPFIKYCETAFYIHRLLPSLILQSKSTLFSAAEKNCMNYVYNIPSITFDERIKIKEGESSFQIVYFEKL